MTLFIVFYYIRFTTAYLRPVKDRHEEACNRGSGTHVQKHAISCPAEFLTSGKPFEVPSVTTSSLKHKGITFKCLIF